MLKNHGHCSRGCEHVNVHSHFEFFLVQILSISQCVKFALSVVCRNAALKRILTAWNKVV